MPIGVLKIVCIGSLEMVFKENLCRARAGYDAENLNVLRHLAMGLLKNESSVKASLNLKRKRRALSLIIC